VRLERPARGVVVGVGDDGVGSARPVGVPAVVIADPAAALMTLAAHVRTLTKATVLAITGSSGKTTTKDLLADLLGALGPTLAPPGSFNNEIGLPLTLLRLEPETEYATLEMGARGIGHIAALCQIARPQVGVVINVGSAHVGEYADGRAGIARAKGELAEAATDVVVLNADDPLVAAMRPRAAGRRVVTFGLDAGADVRAERIELDAAGLASFDLVAAASVAGAAAPGDPGVERHRVALALVGEHQVSNALAAAAAALAVGMTPAAAAAALAAARPRSRWRMEVTTAPSGLVVVNDAYNANPESMRAALRALVGLGAGGGSRRRTWAVLGPMGELGASAEVEHAEIGRFAAGLGVDRTVAIGAAARPLERAAAQAGARVDWVPDVDAATELLAAAALGTGDIVLVKASRAAGLERVAAALTATGAAGPGSAGRDGSTEAAEQTP